MLKISAFLFNTSVDSHESSTTFSCCIIISHQWWSNLIMFMNKNLFNVKINVLNSTTWYTIRPRLCTSKYPVLAKIISFGSQLIACCKLAATLARQMWRHNYVIDGNEYLIFTLSESINPWVYSVQFLFKSINNSWRYERKCEWVFFSEHSVEPYHNTSVTVGLSFSLLADIHSLRCFQHIPWVSQQPVLPHRPNTDCHWRQTVLGHQMTQYSSRNLVEQWITASEQWTPDWPS